MIQLTKSFVCTVSALTTGVYAAAEDYKYVAAGVAAAGAVGCFALWCAKKALPHSLHAVVWAAQVTNHIYHSIHVFALLLLLLLLCFACLTYVHVAATPATVITELHHSNLQLQCHSSCTILHTHYCDKYHHFSVSSTSVVISILR
jgi:hypothetical protein